MNIYKLLSIISLLLLSTNFLSCQENDEKGTILTEWAEMVTLENVWQQYPRPQFERKNWLNLNGIWDFKITDQNEIDVSKIDWKDKILVPFTVESKLSGIHKNVDENQHLYYHTSFKVDKAWEDRKILLNFDGSDYYTTVWLNGKEIGTHTGGYDRFTFNITDFIKKGEKQDLIVRVSDPQNKVFKAQGKQNNGSNQYERASGIWQTVWIEPVNKENHLISVRQETSLDKVFFSSNIAEKDPSLMVKYEVFDGTKIVATKISGTKKISIPITSPKLWSPDTPFLYTTKISLLKGEEVLDEVSSYVGLRTISVSETSKGKQILLNDKPIFQVGPLDQNYWPGGGFTPPSEEAMLWEAKYLKEIGCNMVRLHIKKNPDRYYYNCDKLGLLVWQDFISGPKKDLNPEPKEAEAWLGEQKKLMDDLHNHPSIVLWIPFNEGWGQHDTEEIFKWTREQDSTRLITLSSGWNDIPGLGDIRDLHDYTMRPSIPVSEKENRVLVIGEGGGFASAVPDHNWTGRANETGEIENPLFGGFNPEIPRDTEFSHDLFRPTFTTGKPFEKQYERFIENLILLKNSGLNALIYTQLTDMKLEENGWLTFDRKVSKIDKKALNKMQTKLIDEVYPQTIILGRSKAENNSWKLAKIPFPVEDENNRDIIALNKKPDFTKLKWVKGFGPFTNKSCDNFWNGKEQLLVKNDFEIKELSNFHSIRIYTDLKGKNSWMYSRIYINGEFIADEIIRQKMPESRMAEVIVPKEKKHILRKGKNFIIVQFVPGLTSQSGNIKRVPDDISMNVEVTSFKFKD